MLRATRALVCVAAGLSLAGCGRAVPGGAAEAESASAPGAVEAARALLSVAHDSVRAEVAFPFASPERMRWVFVPQERTGLPFRRMRPEERAAAEALLRTGLSEEGYRKAVAIVRHEATLRELEKAAGVSNYQRRDPELYYTWIFGAPAADSVWGWRFEGHHLSVNVTRVGREGQIVAPVFMGANPARVPSGPQAGFRLLAAEEDLARELLALLTPPQRRRAVIADTTFGEIVTRNDPVARPVPLEGLPYAEMTPPQQALVRRLLELYAGRMAPEAARAQLERIERAGPDRLHFAWAGSDRRGEAHYYRIHGPTVLVEYDNTQNDANHVHTVWRDLENDFGGDLLRRHYARHSHPR